MSTDVTPAVSTLSQRVAEEIRSWMARRRISGASLARQLNVSPAWVSYRLTGAQEIGLNDLQRIAEVLEVEVTDLLPQREGKLIAVGGTSGSSRRESKPWNVSLPKRPRPTGPPSRTEPRPVNPRTGRVNAAHAAI